mgnify:FL=1
MFWNKKENKSGLPDLPPANTSRNKPILEPPLRNTITNRPELIEKEESNEDEEFPLFEERHALPSFPDSPIRKASSS